ncbi:TPA: hypothetical protein ACG4ML_000548 [Stenotrophomonas maltophilia]|uniref:hypothetical protein n=1 Tax=Stenotrophomonas maltophilia TaxID=40324 RepID=UPI002097B624|nr:hypothetical protein [Stenotrophomonas maltophilia]EKT4075723.1 hypothetical protein [Stenotrophomonas maltophilia]MBN5044662.1 hypothetical protein [Stenotrophomonas maltophilia]MCO7477561.1 hypothetical protein [Stenotrophomonas maltophilia]HDS1367136.1 hypothetical protein [Stenotrophomonas maltophilia]HDS1371933.1 hypothetical protein [Stenotrophomonas maltophilia]
MSAPVDVLAVMDIAATSIEHSGGNVAYLRQARAAVAELVKASERVQNQVDPLLHSNGYGYVGAMAGHRRALARVKGGAA